MKSMSRFCCAAVASLTAFVSAQAADRTWTGAADNKWTTAGNWSDNTAPSGNGDVAIFPAGTPTAVVLDQSISIKTIYFRNPGMTLTVAAGVNLAFDNLGAQTIIAEQDATINGDGTLTFSVNQGENWADNQAATGKTLTLLAKITGSNGFEHNGTGGTIVLGNVANDQTGATLLTGLGVLSVASVANSGVASPLGAGSAVRTSYGPCTLRYTGTGNSTDRTFQQNAAAGLDITIEHAGSGTLTFTGPFSSGVNSAHAFIFNVVASTAVIENTGVISDGGTAALTVGKQGAGTHVLSAANTYTGSTLLDAGTLALKPAGSISTASLLRTRGGTLLLNAVSPATTYAATLGSLQVESSASTVAVNPGATSAQVTFAALSHVGGRIDFTADGLGTTTKIFIAGQPDGLIGPWATVNGGTDLAKYSSSVGVYAANLPVQALQALGPSSITNNASSVARITSVGTSGGIALADNPTAIALLSQDVGTAATVGFGGKTLTAPSVQIASGAASLTLGSAPGDGTLTSSDSAGDVVLANANAAGAAALTVNAAIANNGATAVHIDKLGAGDVVLAGPVSHTGGTSIDAGALTLDVASGVVRDFPSGVISGNGGLTKTGAGTIAFPDVANTYAGTTTVANGTACILNSGTFGSTAAPTVVKDGGAIDFRGISDLSLRLSNEQVFAEGAGPDGLGALRNDGAYNQFWGLSYLTLTGPLTVSSNKRLDLRGDYPYTTYLNLNGHGITKKGSDYFGLTQTTVTNDQGTAFFDVTAGAFTLEVNATLSGGSNNYIRVRNGATFDYYHVLNPISWSLNLDDGARVYTRYSDGATNRNVYAGPVTLNGHAIFESGGIYCDTYTGVISGSGALVKSGNDNGVTYLRNADNNWTGGTLVSNSILYAAAPGALPGYATSASVFNSGTLAFRVADAAATQPGFSLAQIKSVIDSGAFKSTTASVGFDTAYENLDYTDAFPHLGIRKFGPNKLTLSGSGSDIGPVHVYGGTLDLSPVSRYLGDQSVVVGESTSTSDPLATLVVGGSAQITTLDRGANVSGQTQVIIGNNGRGVMSVSDTSKINGWLILGNGVSGVGAVYQTGGTIHNTGGAANDGRIGGSGYGYYLLAGGSYTNNGYSQIGQASSSLGILEQTGGTYDFVNAYYGNLGISRGGTGVVHVAGGRFFSNATLWVGDVNENNASGGYAEFTVTGSAVVTNLGSIDLGTRDNMTALLNLNGGELNANHIWRANRSNTDALVNWNGGLFRVNNASETELLSGGASGVYPDVTLYAGGAKVDIPVSTMSLAVNTPLRTPTGLGLVSIPVVSSGTGYLGSPFVKILGGGGKGAAAFAHINPVSGALTSIEITSPGTGFTSAPTVTLIGGGATTAATLGTPVLGLSASGGLTKLGTGTLSLNAANTYTGATEVREGTLRLGNAAALSPFSSVSVTGGMLDLGGNTLSNGNINVTGGTINNGTLATAELNKNGPGTLDLGTTISLNTTHPTNALTPGLWEGRIASSWDTTTPNPKQGIQLTTRAANGACGEYGTINGAYWPINSTYVYSGYLWNRAATNVTWTFAENFDDNAALFIDGNTVLNDGTWDNPTKANITLTPGPHAFEVRFGQGGGGAAGVNSSWWNNGNVSFMVDFQGRNEQNLSNYQLLSDPGDGSLLTLDVPAIRGAGLVESVLPQAWNTTSPGTPMSLQLTTRAGNGALALNSTYAGGLWNGNNHTWIYTGILWNRASTNVTWTWCFTFDDNVMLTIDSNVVRNVTLSDNVVYQNHTLTPGPHPIEVRFGDGQGEVGPATTSGLPGGLTYDPQGRGTTDVGNYILLQDPGDGSLLSSDVESGTQYAHAFVNVNAGTLRIATPLVGLWEGRIASAWDTATPNPKESVQLTTRAVNGWCNSGGSINGAPWPDNSTYVYTGFIWNRTGAPATWTFAENFDDDVLLVIDGTTVLNDTGWNTPTKGTVTLSPGAHTFEARFGQGSGGAAGVNSSWWNNNNVSFMVDFQGRNASDLSNYTLLTDPGDGSRLTRTASDPLVSQGPLASAEVNLAGGTTLDLNGQTNKVAVLKGTGTVANGALSSGTVMSPAGDAAVGTLALNNVSLSSGITYRLTVSGTLSDCLTSTGTLDLSGLTIVPAAATEYTSSTYLVATAAGGFTGNKPAISGFPSKYKLIRHGTDLQLTSQGGTTVIFK